MLSDSSIFTISNKIKLDRRDFSFRFGSIKFHKIKLNNSYDFNQNHFECVMINI